MKYIDTERQLADIFTKPLDSSCFATLWGELGASHPYGLVCGGAFVLSSIFVSFYFSVVFSSYSPKLICFTCYTSLYLLHYAYHYSRMSRNEMKNSFARPG
jgi:hypothetical protein